MGVLMRRRAHSSAVALLALLLSVLALAPCAYAADNSLEYSVKAAYLVKFGGFIEWPPAALGGKDDPFVIGVYGEDPFGEVLDHFVAAHAVQGRRVVLRRLARVEQAGGIQMLYIASSEKERLPQILAAVSGKPILTVSDADMPGVMINFVIDSNRVRFEISLDQAERAGLKLSSKLLNVARAVRTSKG